MRAFKIITKVAPAYSIYLADSAGKAKTLLLRELQDAYRKADYSWIVSCTRVREFDYLAVQVSNSCVAWSDDREHWQLDRGHWWGSEEPGPVEVCDGGRKDLLHSV